MAKRTITTLTPDQQKDLNLLSQHYFPREFKQKFVDSLASTGTIPDELFKQANFNDNDKNMVLGLINNITGGKPTSREYSQEELKSQLGSDFDPGKATDEELKNRIQTYQELGQTGGVLDRASVQRELAQWLKDYRVPNIEQEGKDALTSSIADWIIQNKRYPQADEMRNIVGGGTHVETETVYNPETNQNEEQQITVQNEIPNELANFINDQRARNELSAFVSSQITAPATLPTGEKITDISKNLQDIVGERATRTEREAQLSDFLKTVPGQLEQTTTEFIKPEAERAYTNLRDFIAPEVAQGLNIRGILNSGDLASEMARATGEVQGGIETTYGNLLSANQAFFANAAYEQTLRKAIEANQEVAGQIQFETARQRQEAQNRFKLAQQDIETSTNLSLFRRQQSRALDADRARLARNQDLYNASSRASSARNIGGAVGQIGGAVAGSYLGPAGTVAGGAGGRLAGEEIGGLFT